MKKLLLMLLMLLVTTCIAYGEAGEFSDVRITLLNQDPDPVSAGQYVTLRYQIENNGGVGVEDLQLKLVETYPFSLDASQEQLKDIGILGAYQSDLQQVIVEYKVRVAPDAIAGDNDVQLIYTYKSLGKSQERKKVNTIEVNAVEAAVTIKEVTLSPSVLKPGSPGEITIQIANSAMADLKDVSLALDLSSDTLLFAPIESATEKKMPVLLKNRNAQFTFKVIPYPTATAGVYKIPITLTYYDTSNNAFTTTDIVGVIVGDEPDVSVVVDNPELMVGFSEGDVPVKIINKGIIDLKLMSLIVEPTNKFSLLSPTENYIGNLDSDDFDTIDIEIINKDLKQDAIDIPVKITYKDANNNDFTEDLLLHVQLRSSTKEGGSSIVSLLITLVILGLGFWFGFWTVIKGLFRGLLFGFNSKMKNKKG